jgi:hypothetical protein
MGRGIALLFQDVGTRRGWVVSSTPRPYSISGKDPVPIAQEAGWALGPVWTGAENLAHPRDWSPDRPARSSVSIPTELPGPRTKWIKISRWNCDFQFLFHLRLQHSIPNEWNTVLFFRADKSPETTEKRNTVFNKKKRKVPWNVTPKTFRRICRSKIKQDWKDTNSKRQLIFIQAILLSATSKSYHRTLSTVFIFY